MVHAERVWLPVAREAIKSEAAHTPRSSKSRVSSVDPVDAEAALLTHTSERYLKCAGRFICGEMILGISGGSMSTKTRRQTAGVGGVG